MTVMLDAASVRANTLGTLVQRATATLPQSTDGALFTITGGQVLIVHLVGEVSTVIETQANATKLKYNPDGAGDDQDLCATLDITADPVGELYTISGTVGDAMRSDLWIGNSALAAPLVLAEGDIELDCAASNTGSVAWDLIYVAVTPGASVAAA